MKITQLKTLVVAALVGATASASKIPLEVQSVCGHQFGSLRPEGVETDEMTVDMEKPFRVFDRIRLGYHSHTHKLYSIQLEGNVVDWSFAATTNEAHKVKAIIEEKLGITLAPDRFGSYRNHKSNSQTLVVLTCVPHRRMMGKNKRLDNGTYFSIRVRRNDLLLEGERAKNNHQKKQYMINHDIPADQDRDVLTFSTNSTPCGIIHAVPVH